MTPNGMARAIILDLASRLYGAEDPALKDLELKVQEKIADDVAPEDACSLAVTALMQMLAFPAPGSEENQDMRWLDHPR